MWYGFILYAYECQEEVLELNIVVGSTITCNEGQPGNILIITSYCKYAKLNGFLMLDNVYAIGSFMYRIKCLYDNTNTNVSFMSMCVSLWKIITRKCQLGLSYNVCTFIIAAVFAQFSGC